jgi:hypothetical protein
LRGWFVEIGFSWGEVVRISASHPRSDEEVTLASQPLADSSAGPVNQAQSSARAPVHRSQLPFDISVEGGVEIRGRGVYWAVRISVLRLIRGVLRRVMVAGEGVVGIEGVVAGEFWGGGLGIGVGLLGGVGLDGGIREVWGLGKGQLWNVGEGGVLSVLVVGPW